ncbi:MAG TPA: aldo/keto reductase [Tepidisphaeraceae bacterium]|jgi:aryl-alcohol dehydrogenase-like predicted oxidoreductase
MPTQLNHYRLLGHSGLRVSPLCLGTMTFGEEWGWGASEGESRKLLEAYAEKGGNFLDTADMYTNGTSEKLLGKFLQGRRDQFVLATKYSFSSRQGDPNAGGNHRKHMQEALNASLKRLNTDYIDLYWVHVYDGLTPIEEMMRALDDAVRAGKILYIGVSDFPAWRISQANTLAELKGWTPFVALQIEYSLVERTVERDLIPMARAMGLGVTPWSPLAGGVLTGKYNKPSAEDKRYKGDDPFAKKYVTERNLAIAKEVMNVASQVGRSAAQVALAWLVSKPGVTSTIIGARKASHLQDNLDALSLDLPREAMKKLDQASAVDMGFFNEFVANPQVSSFLSGGTVTKRET